MEPYSKTLKDDMDPIIHLYLMHMTAVWLMYQRLRNKRNRKMYSRPILAQRRRHGDYSHLVQEMRLDPEYHFMYFRMSLRQFEKLAEIVCPYLHRNNTHLFPISATERLNDIKVCKVRQLNQININEFIDYLVFKLD